MVKLNKSGARTNSLELTVSFHYVNSASRHFYHYNFHPPLGILYVYPGGHMKSKSKILKLSLAALFLQRCNESFESNSEAKSDSSSYSNSYGQGSNEFTIGTRPPAVLPSPTPASPTAPPVNPPPPPIAQIPAPTTPSQPTIPPPPISPPPAAVANCAADLQALKWADLNSQEKVKISLNPVDNYWNAQDGYPNEIYAYGGMVVSFQNPYRTGSNNYFRHAPQFRAEGYSIKIKDNTTGAVVEALDSDLTRPHVWSASGQAVMGFIKGVPSETAANGREQFNSVGFHFSRNLYDKIKNFNSATVSLHCNNALVAEGQQDVQALKVSMSQRMVKVGTFQGAGLYSFPANEIFGFININCPLEIIAGSNTQCTGGGLHVSSGYWIVDGQIVSQFNGASNSAVALSLSSLSRGSHSAQVVVTYTNGRTDKTNIFLIKVK